MLYPVRNTADARAMLYPVRNTADVTAICSNLADIGEVEMAVLDVPQLDTPILCPLLLLRHCQCLADILNCLPFSYFLGLDYISPELDMFGRILLEPECFELTD